MLGVPGLEAAPGRLEELRQVEFEARDLAAQEEHLEIDPAFPVADVIVRLLARKRRAALRTRHVLGMGKEGEHHLVNPTRGMC